MSPAVYAMYWLFLSAWVRLLLAFPIGCCVALSPAGLTVDPSYDWSGDTLRPHEVGWVVDVEVEWQPSGLASIVRVQRAGRADDYLDTDLVVVPFVGYPPQALAIEW
jgi:hypothetical protein